MGSEDRLCPVSILLSWEIDVLIVVACLAVPSNVVSIFILRVLCVHFPLSIFAVVHWREECWLYIKIQTALYSIAIIAAAIIWYR